MQRLPKRLPRIANLSESQGRRTVPPYALCGAWVAPLVVETARQTDTGCEGTVDGCLPSARQVPRPSPSSKAAIWLAEQMQRSSAAFARQATCTLSTPARPYS